MEKTLKNVQDLIKKININNEILYFSCDNNSNWVIMYKYQENNVDLFGVVCGWGRSIDFGMQDYTSKKEAFDSFIKYTKIFN